MIQFVDRSSLLSYLNATSPATQHFVILATGAMLNSQIKEWYPYLDAAYRVLREGGLLFVQGVPETLPELGIYLDKRLRFKYWIAVESTPRYLGHGLPSTHAAILMFSKGNKFNISRVRFPHQFCSACGKPLRDWGGKTHLMNPEGFAISDVWKSLPLEDNYTQLSKSALEILSKLASSDVDATGIAQMDGVIGPTESIAQLELSKIAEPTARYSALAKNIQYPLPGLEVEPHSKLKLFDLRTKNSSLYNVVIQNDAVEALKQYPDQSVDLVFADPPYNLDKAYNAYEDEKDMQAYLDWCNSWLDEYIRILKPTGSLYVLNLPRWAMYHAKYLNQRLHFQNWIVWDALSEPRGKLMPAHYALLFYTKHPTDFTFNYEEVGAIDARVYCLRSTCIRQRKVRKDDVKEALTDIWWDIHRIKHRRDRDYHPCQLPNALLERIIRLSTNPGDVVLDALAGTGTTAVAAAKLGRKYVAIDIDEMYVDITRQKLEQVEAYGRVEHPSTKKPRARYIKKSLQLELRDIALKLGRLPTPEDVQKMSRYGLEAFLETFPTWGKALKAAKLEVNNTNHEAA